MSGSERDDPADAGRRALEARERGVPALGHLGQLAARRGAKRRRFSAAHASAAGPCFSAAASAMCSGARTGSARSRSQQPPGDRGARLCGLRHRTQSSPRPRVVLSASHGPKWWTLVAVCMATFMLLLDITIVNVALPSIERDLGADLADLQWVVDAYALTLARCC